MTVDKPQGLHRLLTDSFSLQQLAEICHDMGIDVEDLPVANSSKSARATAMIQYAENQGRLDRLLNGAQRQRPQINFHPYLYALIADQFKTIQDMQTLSGRLGIDYTSQLVQKFGWFAASQESYVIDAQAWEIYRLMAEAERLGALVGMVQELRPHLDLSIFAAQTPPTDTGQAGGAGSTATTEATTPAPRLWQYKNFELRINDAIIRRADGGSEEKLYEVEVLHAPQGATDKVAQTVDLSDQKLQDLLAYVRDLWAQAGDAVQLGQKLQQYLLPTDVWTSLRENLAAVSGPQQGLRLQLRIDPPELSRLPWEYVYRDTFLAHDLRTPIVRYSARLPEMTLQAELPLRILLVTANPRDDSLDDLRVDDEEALVHEALRPLTATGLAHINVIQHAQVSAVRRAVQNGGYHVFHFIGHGVYENEEGAILLEQDDGTPRKLFAPQMVTLLQNSTVKVVILNACETAFFEGANPLSSVAHALLLARIPAVLAMQFQVPDSTSRLFSQSLYESLVLGKPLDQAVTEMRRAAYIDNEDRVFWGIPVLHLGSTDGVIWQPDAAAMEKLAAYRPETPLAAALRRAEEGFPAIRAELDTADAQEFAQKLAQAREAAVGDLDAAGRQALRQQLVYLFGLLQFYPVPAEAATKAALTEARTLLAG